MKKINILIVCFVITFSVFAQQKGCRINIVNPKYFLEEIDSLRTQKQYDSIIKILIGKVEKDTITLFPYYQLACFYSLKGDTIKSFNYLYKSIIKGAPSEDILSDSDFEELKKTHQWSLLTDTLIYQYIKQYPKITNKELSIKLWLMGIEDQRTRALGGNYKKKYPPKGDKEWKNINKQFRKETKERANFILSLVKQGKWPTYSEVGEKAADAALFIVQHCDNNKLYRKAFPLLKNAVETKEASGENYALMLDRYLVNKGKKQIYGTQLYRYQRKGVWSDIQFRPIEDEENVNARRKAVGLGTIEEYAKDSFGIEYIYQPKDKKKK